MAEGPVLQVALDFVNLAQALRAAEEAVAGGAEWVEAGTPLVKAEGMAAVRALRQRFPEATIVADLKIMDAGRTEVEFAAKAGADVVTVLGVASDETIVECVDAGRNYDALVQVDLIGCGDPVARARRAQELGAAIVGIHTAIDDQLVGVSPMQTITDVREAIEIRLAVAGGINSETAPEAIKAGADIVIVGGAIIKAPDATEAARTIVTAIRSGEAIETELFKRGGEEQLREIFTLCSAANISDAMHRRGLVPGIFPIKPGLKAVGPALTVWTYPGDWAKPVEAIDQAEEGAVLFIDVRDGLPAVWGEEATKSCISRGLAGVLIYGAMRDTAEIAELDFPAFCSQRTPSAGEPKGMGMIGVPLKIGETMIRTGDWIIADDDGVIVVPREQAVAIANRSQSVYEREQREKGEIDAGRTLGEIAELKRWEAEGGLSGFASHGPEGEPGE
ncbi:MAG TPA: bifunctional hexulose-6-phosphate synthase/ribonuclease regulator [Armatimonadetes bacterium]|nr:bifunctional hexulose-6-phosphate synthase/ribonuclease regulator [Armatimonadota bacterium]